MPTTSRTTQRSTPRLSEVARAVSAPQDAVSTGWPAVRKTCVEKLGIEFDSWQEQVGSLILAKRADGSLAATVDGVGMSLPRQVGKTYLIASMVFALSVNTPGLLVIWTAHHMATSSETFLALQGFAKRSRVAPHVRQVFTGSGDEEIRFHNGSRILFGARERGFGRGIPGVDVLIFDEAQILSDKAMSNMLATMNTSRFGLHLYVGTPPKPEDMSETFRRMREQAAAGTLIDGAWVEFGADKGADPKDRKQWAKANPSYPHRTPAQSIQRLQRKLTPADFLREGLGIWDDAPGSSRLITPDQWEATAVTEPPTSGTKSFGVAFSLDGLRVSVAGAMKHDDGVHVELVGAHSGSAESGVAPLADWLAERWRETSMIAVSGRAGADALARALADRGVPGKVVHVCSTTDYFAACSLFHDAVRERSVTHLATEGQAVLDASVSVSDQKFRGTAGAWGWQATTADGDETPVEAVSLAQWAARTSKRRPGRRQKAVVM